MAKKKDMFKDVMNENIYETVHLFDAFNYYIIFISCICNDIFIIDCPNAVPLTIFKGFGYEQF